MAENPYYLPKKDLFEWLENDLGIQVSNPSECGNGVVYLKILDKLYPGGKVPLRKVRMEAKLEWECRHNLKLLQQVFQDLDIKRALEIERLSAGKPADNLELLQWLKGYYDRTVSQQSRSPDAQGSVSSGGVGCSASFSAPTSGPVSGLNNRGAGVGPVGNSNRSSIAASSSGGANSMGRSQTTTGSHSNTVARASPKINRPASTVQRGSALQPSKTSQEQSRRTQGLLEALQQKDQLINQLQTDLEAAETESRFYFGKLRRLEVMSMEQNRESFSVDEVQSVLFTEDDFVEDTTIVPPLEPNTVESLTTANFSSDALSNSNAKNMDSCDPTTVAITRKLKINEETTVTEGKGSPVSEKEQFITNENQPVVTATTTTINSIPAQ